MVAPLDLAEHCLALIAREAEHARHGRPARIIAKMNALLDKNIITALYRASQAGVKIDLIVRGICALRPGSPRGERPYPGAQHRGPLPGAQPHFFLCERWTGRECIWAAPTGCLETFTSGWK